jgi:hypothetical protein
MFVETPANAPESVRKTPFSSITVGSSGDPPKGSTHLLFNTQDPANLCTWPHLSDNPRRIGGFVYRVRYRLEKHPDWQAHDLNGAETASENIPSSFRGVYVLTVVCYRDTDQSMSKPMQIADPVIVYLKDGKQR